MAQHYSNPKRAHDAYALPDVEVFYMSAADFAEAKQDTWQAHKLTELEDTPWEDLAGWYYWYCLPGCLPDSEPCGPFATEAEALREARESAGEDAEEEQSQS